MTQASKDAQAASRRTDMPISNGSPDRSSTRLAHEIGDLIIDKKGEDLVVIDVERVTSLADLIVIATGRSKRQVLAMAEEIHFFAKRSGITVVSEEGREQGWWVLVDFGDVVVHIMQDEARAYYDLERLWGDGEVVRRVSGDGEGLTTGD